MSGGARYLPVMLLGQGGMAEVHLGVLLGAAGFRRPIVLKRVSRAAADPEAAKRALVREALVASALNHPHVIHVYELIDTPEGLALAMEYLPGVSAAGLLTASGAALPWPIAARIGADVARGLHHAHGARGSDGAPLGIVHRDVSPANVLVTEDGIAKLVDFGIARSALRAETVTTLVRGTAAYVSPEQARGRTLDARSDVFSLGVLLHELLAGAHPFDRGSPAETMQAIAGAPEPALGDDVPAIVRETVTLMLQKNASLRTLGAGDVADRLEGAAAGRGGTHRDVADYLRAEVGSQLAARRRLVGEILAGASVRAEPVRADTATLMLLEAVLDRAQLGSTSSEHAPLGGDEATDTELDGRPETTRTEVDR